MPDYVQETKLESPAASSDCTTDSSMQNEIRRYKMHQENARLKQEIDELRASQGRKAKYDESTSFYLKTKEMADSKFHPSHDRVEMLMLSFLAIRHNILVTHIKALLLQTRIAILTSDNAAATTAISGTRNLLSSSSSLTIPVSSVLHARCTFWHGMFFYRNKEYTSALECVVLATEALSTVMLPEIGTPQTPYRQQLQEGAFEAGMIAKMKLKAELEIQRTPATATTAMIATPATARLPILESLKEESVVPLSARLWKQTSHSSLADELSSLDDVDSSSNSDDECSDMSSNLLQPFHQEHHLSVESHQAGLEAMPLPFRYSRPGSSASMTSLSSIENNLAERRHASKPANLETGKK